MRVNILFRLSNWNSIVNRKDIDLKNTGSIKTQKLLHTPKRLAANAARYAADEGGILSMRKQWLQEAQARLSSNRINRFLDYDRLAFLHLSIGDIRQIAFGDTKSCKDHLYQSAVYKSYACQYVQSTGDKVDSKGDINLRALVYFEVAVIADAYEIAHTLGNHLLHADQGFMPPSVEKIEGALIHLFNGNDSQVKEDFDFIKSPQNTRWTGSSVFDQIELYEALLKGDNQKFYDLFVASLRQNRRDPNLVYFLDFLHIAIGKIAIKRGFELPVDTADCPQCLLQPDRCDYSSVEIHAPIEGLPW